MSITKKKTVLCFGDSNTYGLPPISSLSDFGRYDRQTRWPCVMHTHLGDDFLLVEEGHSGRTTVHTDEVEGEHKNGLAALPIILESHMPMDYFIMMLGTNDLKTRFSVSALEIAIGLQRLVHKVQSSGAGPNMTAPKILLISPAVIFERGVPATLFRGGRQKSMGLAHHIREIAQLMGTEFLDAAELIDSDTEDGIHLSKESHAVLGLAVAEKIKQMDNG